MGSLISVGEKYPLFEELTQQMMHRDGGVLESLEHGEGFWFNMYLDHPHAEEIRLVREEEIHVRVIQEGDFVLPLIRFGDSVLMYEMSFDPTLYKDQRAFQLVETNNQLTIVLVDSSNAIVTALRQANLPLRLTEIWYKAWKNAFKQAGYSAAYKQWVGKLQQLPLDALWFHANIAGTLGEMFDLEEIKKFNKECQ